MNQKIRVLFVHHHGVAGGAQRSLLYLIKNFPAGTIEPIVLTPNGGVVKEFEQVAKVIIIPSGIPEFVSIAGGKLLLLRSLKAITNLRTLGFFRNIIDEVKPDIVHLNEVSLGLLARIFKRKKYRVVLHARVVLSDRVPYINYIIRHYIRKYVDAIVAIDGSVAKKLALPSISHIVHNPLHQGVVENPLPFHPNRCNVLFLSNLIPYKGIYDLIEASKLLRDKKVKILIAGSNSRSREFFATPQGKFFAWIGLIKDVESDLKKIILEYRLEHVELIGHVSNINEVFKKTDVLVFPSHMNGPSRSVFEAGALGIPSILSLRNKVEDVVKDGETGLIIGERDPQSIADAILKLANDVAFRKKLSDNAFVHFNALNNAASSASKVLAIYRELLR